MVFAESWTAKQAHRPSIAPTSCFVGELFGEIQALGLRSHIGKNVTRQILSLGSFAYKLRASSFAKPPEDTSRFAFDQFLLYSAPVGYLRRHLEMSCTFSFSLARLLLIHGTRDSQDIIFNRPRERIIFGETEWIDKRIGAAAVFIGPIHY